MKHEKRIGRQRRRRRYHVRNKLKRNATRPRLSVFRSHKHTYAQILDDENGRTLAAASTLDKEVREELSYGGNRQAAEVVGKLIAQKALEAGIQQVVFDRGEYKYHGRVAALADAARDAGLDIGSKKPAPKAETATQQSKSKKAQPKRKKAVSKT